MAKKKKQPTGLIANRRARHEYALGDRFKAGLVLTGAETKSLRLGHGHLRGAFVTFKDGELWLTNATIQGTRGVPIPDNEVTRPRKLLVTRRELEELTKAKQQGSSLIPTALLIKGRYIKLEFSIGQGKKRYDKRQTIKQRDMERSNLLELKRRRG